MNTRSAFFHFIFALNNKSFPSLKVCCATDTVTKRKMLVKSIILNEMPRTKQANNPEVKPLNSALFLVAGRYVLLITQLKIT